MTEIIVADPPPANTPAAETEAIIANAEASVEIEEVRQEGETARAEIAAEVAEAHIEAAAEVAKAVTREEFDTCQANIETMRQTLEMVASQVQLISETLVEEEPEEPPSPNESPDSGRTDNPGPTEQALANPETGEPPQEPVKKKPRINWT